MYLTTTAMGFFILSCTFQSDVVSASCKVEHPNNISNPLIGVINDFSFKIAEKLTTDDNYFFSPLSLYMALSMLANGASGRTKSQLQQVLQYKSRGITEKEVVINMYNVISMYDETQDMYDLFLANGMFVQDGFPISKQYQELLQYFYHAIAKNVNFWRETTTEEINSWVSNQTKKMIPNLLSRVLNPLMRLMLLNVEFFKGIWKHQFPEDKTFDDWMNQRGNWRKVKMMELKHRAFEYVLDKQTDSKFLKLPYEGNDIAMLLALPYSQRGHRPLKNDDELRRINKNMRCVKFDTVQIPKFRMKYSKRMNEILKDLGVIDAFITGLANFTGIRKENDLHVSSVRHDAVIEVDERGSKAAAVTTIGIMVRIAASSINPTFIAKPPFTFYIIDERNGLILFSGKLTDP